MSESAKLAAKTPDPKKENSAFQTKKTNFSKSTNSPFDQILFFQRTVGNQALHRLIKSGVIQAKLTIGQHGDIYEQEADQISKEVMPDLSTHNDALAGKLAPSERIKIPRLRQWNAVIGHQPGFEAEQLPSFNLFGRKLGSTLPYREATELAKCIRIMGEESAAYCRKEVLGERETGFLGNCALGIAENPVVNPMMNISVFQSPGASGWWGAKFGCYRNGCTRRHTGWDIHAAGGTPIQAVVTGTMTRHNEPTGYGQYVILRSSANPQREYLYAHLSRRESGGFYCAGDKLGETGTSGNASANRPHLHFEVRTNGARVDPVNFLTEPSQVIEATGSAVTNIDKTLPAPCNPC